MTFAQLKKEIRKILPDAYITLDNYNQIIVFTNKKQKNGWHHGEIEDMN